MIFKSYLSAYRQYDLNNNTQGINSLKDNCILALYATCIIMPNPSLYIIKLLTVHVLNFFPSAFDMKDYNFITSAMIFCNTCQGHISFDHAGSSSPGKNQGKHSECIQY